MNESFGVAAYSHIAEMAFRVLAWGAVILLVLETVYLLSFTVFVARRTGQHKPLQPREPPDNVAGA